MEELEQQVGLAGKIEAIDKAAVHRICSGQVVLTLATAVKELVENSLDAGASCIDVRLKNYGLESIEVIDNGVGVEECNFQALTLKHYTSKLRDFSDLTEVTTFGFRGEALSSLCALSKVSVTTCHQNSSVGSKLQFDHNGKLANVSPSARQVGTTVLVEDLFSTLPVRHKEFERNIKKEFVKMVQTLTSYCLMSINVKITCSNQISNSKRSTALSISGNSSVRENIIDVFGIKQMNSLVEFKQSEPTEEECSEFDLPSTTSVNKPCISLTGFISSAVHGEGRSSADRQFYYINRRPCDPTKIIRLVNDVYHTYNRHQYPFVAINLQIDTDCADINVTPDKRQILVQHEVLLLATIKASLSRIYESSVGFSVGDSPSMLGRQTSLLQSPLWTRNQPEQGSSTPVLSLLNLKRSYSSSFCRPNRSTTSQESSNKQKKLDEFVLEKHSRIDATTRLENSDVLSEDDVMNIENSCSSTHLKTLKDAVSSSIVSDGLQAKLLPQHSIDLEDVLKQKISDAVCDVIPTPRALVDSSCSSRLSEWQAERLCSATGSERENIPTRLARFASAATQFRNVSVLNCRVSNTSKAERSQTANDSDVENDINSVSANRTCVENDINSVSAYRTCVENDINSVSANRTCVENNINSVSANRTCVENDINSVSANRMCVENDINSVTANRTCESLMLNKNDSLTVKNVSDEDSQLETVNNNVIWELTYSNDQSSIGSVGCEPDGRGEVSSSSSERNLSIDLDACDNSLSEETTASNPGPAADINVDVSEPISKKCVVLHFSMSQLKNSLQYHQRRNFIESGRQRAFIAKISPTDNQAAEAELQKELKKDMFKKMEIIGQFNLGFIISRLGSDLFIIDQHATDEKFNFETMQKTTTLQGQKLIQPVSLHLTAVNESILLDNLEIFRKNGFDFLVDLNAAVQQRALLTCIPVSGNWSFSQQVLFSSSIGEQVWEDQDAFLYLKADVDFTPVDIEEMIFVLSDSPGIMCRPSRVRAMFASRACRSSVMIGTALNKAEMKRLVTHMGEIDQPWNCPHGRPTIRHLFNLDMLTSI